MNNLDLYFYGIYQFVGSVCAFHFSMWAFAFITNLLLPSEKLKPYELDDWWS